MAAMNGAAGSLESCVRAQLFSIQVSIVDAHEQVLAIVREHVGTNGTTIQRGTKQGTKSTVGAKLPPMKIVAPTLLAVQPEHSEGSSCSNGWAPVSPPALPIHPPPPSDASDRDRLLEPPRADGDEDSQSITNLESRRSSQSNAIESFLAEEERRHHSKGSAQGKPVADAREEEEEETVAVPGAMPEKNDDTSDSSSEHTEETDVSNDGEEVQVKETQIEVGEIESRSSCSEEHGAEFELLDIWHPIDLKKKRGSVKAALQKARGESLRPPDAMFLREINSEDFRAANGEFRAMFCTVHPHSMKRGCWDFCSLILVAYDMIFIPMQLFDIPPNAFTLVMSWTTRLFWTADIVASFITGYVREDGSIELSMKRIARRYIQSWFGLDAIIVFGDWMEILWDVTGGAGYARMGKASRIIRIVRMVRLLRLVRMQQVMKLIIERIHSERLTIMADILRITTVIAGFAHIMACVWYGISVKGGNTTWVAYYEMLERDLEIRYTCALHWSFSQFTGGMDEFVPQNLEERIFAIVVFLLAFLLSSVFVSSLTSSMTQLNMIASHCSQKLSTLRKYMQQNGISKKVAMRVQRNAQFALREQQRFMPEDQVVVMEIVSEPLRVEVHFEMYSAVINVHPFFDRYIEECPQVMRKVCHCAMSMLQVSFGDIIFSPGETALQPRMFFVTSGNLHYVAASAEVFMVEERTWISEAVIWTTWMHRGQLTATRECRLCVIEAPVFQQVVSKFEHPDFDPRYYAAAFVKDLNANLTEIVDLPSDRFDYEAALGAHAQGAINSQPRVTNRFSVMMGKVQQQVKSGGVQMRRSIQAPRASVQQPRASFAAQAPRASLLQVPRASRPSVQAPGPRRSVAQTPRRSVQQTAYQLGSSGPAPRVSSPPLFSPVISEASSAHCDFQLRQD